MYCIVLDNCCCEPSIKMEFTFDKEIFIEVVAVANRGFRSIQITDADTGEVVYSRYVSDQHFHLHSTYQSVGDCVNDLCKYARYKKGV